MRKKISIGFLCLALLLLFAGVINIFDLHRLQMTTETIVRQGAQNAALAERLLDALQLQNTSVIKMIVSEDAVPDESYERGKGDFDQALGEAAGLQYGKEDLQAIYEARDNYRDVIAGYANEELERDMEWFASTYLDAFYELDEAIKDYLTSPRTSLLARTAQLEKNVYKSNTPSILTLFIALIIVVMFYFFVDHYYVKPLLTLNGRLKKYLTAKLPFDDAFETTDELTSLKEMVDELIEKSKH